MIGLPHRLFHATWTDARPVYVLPRAWPPSRQAVFACLAAIDRMRGRG